MLHMKAHSSLPQNLATVIETGILISLKWASSAPQNKKSKNVKPARKVKIVSH